MCYWTRYFFCEKYPKIKLLTSSSKSILIQDLVGHRGTLVYLFVSVAQEYIETWVYTCPKSNLSILIHGVPNRLR